MPSPWDPAGDREESWSDREAWRGDVHPEADGAWTDESASNWEPDNPEVEGETPWADPGAGWPEDLAGPEYWMYRDWER